MGLFSGLKKIGRGIGRGVKKGVKAFDKFDDWIKLKELAQIGSFIPGVNVIAKPLSMVYSGYDVAKNVKEGNLLGAGLSGLQMYGTSKINTTGFGGGAKGLNIGSTGAEALSRGIDPNATIGFRSQLTKNIGNFLNPFGLSASEQAAFNTVGMPLLKQVLPGGEQASPKRQGYSPSYQPMEYGQIQGFSPTTQLPAQAQGGITGDDWHKPINRLPANYEGWVTEPSIATLGEQGKEAVLPLNKLLPAMNKGGLNYSTGHAIVGEAGPEYVTRLGPGEEHWAQKILDMPAMKEGGIAGSLKRLAFPRMLPGGGATGLLSKMVGKGARFIPGVGLMYGVGEAGQDLYDLYQGKKDGKEYGMGDWGKDQISNIAWALPWGSLGLAPAYDYARGEYDEGIDAFRDLLGPQEAQAQTIDNRSTESDFQFPRYSDFKFGPGNNIRPPTQFREEDQTTPVPPTTSIQPESNMVNPLGDLEGLLDFDNPESNVNYWKKKDPDRLEAMVNDLVETSMADLSDNEKRGMVQESWRQAGPGVPAPGVSYPLPSNQDINYIIGSGGRQQPSPQLPQVAPNQMQPTPSNSSLPPPQSLLGETGGGRQQFFQSDLVAQQAFRAMVEENQRLGRYFSHSDGNQYPYPEYTNTAPHSSFDEERAFDDAPLTEADFVNPGAFSATRPGASYPNTEMWKYPSSLTHRDRPTSTGPIASSPSAERQRLAEQVGMGHIDYESLTPDQKFIYDRTLELRIERLTKPEMEVPKELIEERYHDNPLYFGANRHPMG